MLIPFCAGISAGSYITLPLLPVCLIMAVCAVLLFLIHSSGVNDRNPFFGIVLSVFLLLTGFASGMTKREGFSVLPEEKKIYAAEVADFPEKKEKSILIRTRLRASLTDSVVLNGGILLYHRDQSLSEKILPGDILIFYCMPREIKNRGNPCEFNYRKYMERHGYRYLAYTEENDIIKIIRRGRPGLVNRALITRHRIVTLYENKGLKGDALALASAVTLGEKSLLDDEQKDNFSRAGVMHIMAVSGLHAGILSLFIFRILFFLKGRLNFLRVLVTITVIWIFAFITGLSPSITRASLMFSFLHAGKLSGRNPSTLNSLLASAFLILLFNPLILPDASFLLSFTAVAFIIQYYNNIYGLYVPKWKITGRLWEMISVSVTAQAGTLPLTVMFFNRLPLLFLFSNLVIIPVASLIVISGFLTVIFSFAGPLSDISAFILEKSSSFAGTITEFTASLPFSSSENPGMGTAECILLVLLIGVGLDSLRNGSINGKYIIILLFLLSLDSLIINLRLKPSNELIVYNIPGEFYAGIRTGRTLEILCYNDTMPAAVRRHCAQERLGLKIRKLDREIPCMIRADQHKIMISDCPDPGQLSYTPDLLIVTGKKASFSGNYEKSDGIIFTSAFPAPRPAEADESNNGTIPWFVREKGCFRMKL